jgi:hypothetical protein
MDDDSSADIEVFAGLTELRHLSEHCRLRQFDPVLTFRNLQIKLRKMTTAVNFLKVTMIP